jgi:hypothetical protein
MGKYVVAVIPTAVWDLFPAGTRVSVKRIEDTTTDTQPFMRRDGGKYVVLYANETKSQTFNNSREAEKFRLSLIKEGGKK